MKTEFTWENFRSKAIAVRCSNEYRAKQFLTLCKNAGFTWDSGAKINPEKQTYYLVNGRSTCYIARADFPRIGFRSHGWALDNGYTVIDLQDIIVTSGKAAGYVAVSERLTDDAACGDKAAAEVHTHHHARWRDAESDKPIKDGEYVVLVRWIADGKFHTGLYITMFDTSSNRWGFIDNNEYVITHWLDGVPELPEVVVR